MQPHYLPSTHTSAAAASDTIDVADVARTVRRQWRAVIACVAGGLAIAGGVMLLAPRRFDGKASVYAKAGSQGASSIAGRMTGLGELLGNLGGLGLAGSLETELQLLRSRTLAGLVVDSLQLQFRVKDPTRIPPAVLIASSELAGAFKPHTYQFQRLPDGRYQTERDGRTYAFVRGQPGKLDLGTVTLRVTELPSRFSVKIHDREEAIDRFGKRLAATKAGGDMAKVVYRGDDSLTAAAGANALVKFYLDRRKTVDRGVNQRRVEFVTEQLQSTARDLATTESDLRKYQEESRIFDAAIMGQVELEAVAEMRLAFTELQVDEAAINQLLAQAESGSISASDLAAYPAFMVGSPVTPLAQQLSDLEGQRIRLLERRTERDPEVLALDSTASAIRANLASMARSYASSVTRQRQQMQGRIDSIQNALLALPAAAERGGRLQRDVMRLTAIYTALEAQLVEARLAAIGEGGEVRQEDVAVPQRKPAFPRPWLTMGIGGGGGLLAGFIAALFLGWFGRWLRDPAEVERAIGISAQRIDPDAPLLVTGAVGSRSVLVVPLGARARMGAGTVVQRLARTAQQRAIQAAVLDMSASRVDGNGKLALEAAQVGATIDQMERDNIVTIVQLPDLSSDVTLAALRENRPVLLVAPPGPVDRTTLARAVDTLRRMQIPIAGVVLSDSAAPRALL
ncbi:MAG TPA: GNVR domain-containing protein [Gemmatimonadaceae bacterium]|nr:GNVR domain-containing protein [Gemmatimonadaceae bacterium]